MKLETYNTKLIFTAIFLFSIFLFSTSVSAAGLIPCGTTANPTMCTVCDFYKLIQNIINFLLYVFASLATLMVIYIAFLFLFSGGSPTKITDAKGKLWLVIIGIFWVLGSWLVLNTVLNLIVNKGVFPWPWNTINCEVSRPSLPFQPPPGATTTLDILNTDQTINWGGEKLSEGVARNQLQQAGINIFKNKSPCPPGVSYKDVTGGCTSLEGVKQSTIDGAIQLKNKCQCALEVSGGTELGHAQGTISHASGNKLDFISNSVLEQYIVNNFTYSGLRTGGAKLYKAPDGSLYARELDHWDVTFVK